MAESTLSLTFADLYAEVSDYLGYGRTATGTKLAEAKRHGHAGYRRFLAGMDPRTSTAYKWSFLSPHATIEFWANTTGTTPLTLTGTTDGAGNSATAIGMSAATFYATMVGHRLKFTGGSYEIIGYASGKSVTVLGNALGESSSGSSITANGVYALPDDYGHMVDNPAYETDEVPGTLQNRSVAWIRHQRSGEGTVTGSPYTYAVAPRTFATRRGQRYDLLVWPIPSSQRTVAYRYRVNPDAMSHDNDFPYGGAMHADTILACCKAAAEEHMEDKAPLWQNRAKEAIAASIDMDAKNKPGNLGTMTDDSDDVSPTWDRRGEVSYG